MMLLCLIPLPQKRSEEFTSLAQTPTYFPGDSLCNPFARHGSLMQLQLADHRAHERAVKVQVLVPSDQKEGGTWLPP